MSRVRNYRDLDAWNKSMDLVVEVYHLTRGFPVEERYGLTSQIRRAAASIPTNIAEGNARLSQREYAYFVSVARGSVSELATLLELADPLGYVDSDVATAARTRAEDISRMLLMLVRALRRARRVE